MKGLVPVVFTVALLSACGRGSGSPGTSDVPVAGGEESQVYFSSANPGKWKDYKVDHQPAMQAKGDGDMRTITIEVPLKPSLEHYIEAIVLVDGQNREIAKATLNRGDKPTAIFSVPAGRKGELYAVAKCNLHDMWRMKVE